MCSLFHLLLRRISRDRAVARRAEHDPLVGLATPTISIRVLLRLPLDLSLAFVANQIEARIKRNAPCSFSAVSHCPSFRSQNPLSTSFNFPFVSDIPEKLEDGLIPYVKATTR